MDFFLDPYTLENIVERGKCLLQALFISKRCFPEGCKKEGLCPKGLNLYNFLKAFKVTKQSTCSDKT